MLMENQRSTHDLHKKEATNNVNRYNIKKSSNTLD